MKPRMPTTRGAGSEAGSQARQPPRPASLAAPEGHKTTTVRIDRRRHAALRAAAEAAAISPDRLLAEALDAHLARLARAGSAARVGEPPHLVWPPRGRRKPA